MDLLINLLPLLIFGGLLFLIFRRAGGNQKALLDVTNKATESYNRLAESVDRLADVISKK